jgi:hypothetical protein
MEKQYIVTVTQKSEVVVSASSPEEAKELGIAKVTEKSRERVAA